MRSHTVPSRLEILCLWYGCHPAIYLYLTIYLWPLTAVLQVFKWVWNGIVMWAVMLHAVWLFMALSLLPLVTMLVHHQIIIHHSPNPHLDDKFQLTGMMIHCWPGEYLSLLALVNCSEAVRLDEGMRRNFKSMACIIRTTCSVEFCYRYYVHFEDSHTHKTPGDPLALSCAHHPSKLLGFLQQLGSCLSSCYLLTHSLLQLFSFHLSWLCISLGFWLVRITSLLKTFSFRGLEYSIKPSWTYVFHYWRFRLWELLLW